MATLGSMKYIMINVKRAEAMLSKQTVKKKKRTFQAKLLWFKTPMPKIINVMANINSPATGRHVKISSNEIL